MLEAMDRQNREKEAVANMRKEFSANVSHELKTPLTSISGYAEIMKNGLVRPEDIPVFSERIYKEARRLITLTPCVARPAKRMSPTGMRIVSPERLMIIRSFSSVTALIAISLPVFSVI